MTGPLFTGAILWRGASQLDGAPIVVVATGLGPQGSRNAKTGAEILRGRTVRLGAYGDPAAVPFQVWQALLAYAAAWTGYTHQWRRAPELAAYCMASVDTPGERAEARFLGFRTFRVRAAGQAVETREVVCPASAEAAA